MNIRAALLDFDGTMVTKDLLDVLCGLAGKLQESVDINQRFHDGLVGPIESLTQRINLLNGVSAAEAAAKIHENLYLMKGARELTEFFRKKGIVSILNSGQILTALEVYQTELGIDHIVGTNPKIQDGIVVGIPPEYPIDVDFKWIGCSAILDGQGILPSEIVAIGDSMADKLVFGRVDLSIAINPKGGIEEHADHVIEQDLSLAIPIIEQAMAE